VRAAGQPGMKRKTWKLPVVVFVGLFGVAAGFGIAEARRQPLMRDALHDLQVARATLEAASPDKGGHRVKAIELTEAAMAEVKLGIEFDNHH
jgi:hypothetical protein